jgi:Xaa-Pro aminopeptidase
MNNLIAECVTRREQLAAKIPNGSIVIIPGSKTKYRNADVDYTFRQESNFYYLTGFVEPDAMLTISKDCDGEVISILFSLPKIWEEEIWTGYRVGQVDAKEQYKFDIAYAYAQMDTELPKLIAGKTIIYYTIGQAIYLDRKISQWIKLAQQQHRNKFTTVPEQLHDIRNLIGEMRLIKSSQEITLLRTVATISAIAHKNLMQICQPGMRESQLAAEFAYRCSLAGCNSLAYNSIVGGGENSCILHYVANSSVLQDKQLVLIDAGGEYNYYAADITRTFPVNGKFTLEQKVIYNLVLQAQQSTINKIKPGIFWGELQANIVQVIVTGLVDLGLLSGDINDLIASKAYRKFYMHNSGHWLGLDVHDVGSYIESGAYRVLKPGMVLTVEPGIYISKHLDGVASKWHSIGVRIEDDVLVTETGCEVLSKDVPKEVIEIEQLMHAHTKI